MPLFVIVGHSSSMHSAGRELGANTEGSNVAGWVESTALVLMRDHDPIHMPKT